MKTLTCPISSIDYYNHDTRRVFLELPDSESIDFKAGQYLQMILPEKKCPFSIASSPHLKNKIELHVRPTADSDDSAAVEALLDTAREIEIEIPLGDCFITSAPGNTLILMAASTGITQMKSIVEFLEPDGFNHPVHLYWGVVTDTDLYLAELCESWQEKYDNFYFTPVVSEPETSPSWQGKKGLVVDALLSDFQSFEDVTVYVSGGPGMVYATLDALVDRGMPEGNMYSDIFAYAPRK